MCESECALGRHLRYILCWCRRSLSRWHGIIIVVRNITNLLWFIPIENCLQLLLLAYALLKHCVWWFFYCLLVFFGTLFEFVAVCLCTFFLLFSIHSFNTDILRSLSPIKQIVQRHHLFQWHWCCVYWFGCAKYHHSSCVKRVNRYQKSKPWYSQKRTDWNHSHSFNMIKPFEFVTLI